MGGGRHDVDKFVAGGQNNMSCGYGRAIPGRDDNSFGAVLDHCGFHGGIEACLALQGFQQQPSRQLAWVEGDIAVAENGAFAVDAEFLG